MNRTDESRFGRGCAWEPNAASRWRGNAVTETEAPCGRSSSASKPPHKPTARYETNWTISENCQESSLDPFSQLIFLDAGNNQLQVSESQYFDPTTQLDAWQYFQVTATAPAGTTTVRVQLLHVGQAGISGSIWWDSVSAAVTPDTRSIAQWTFTRDVPPSCDENVDWNLWLINGWTNSPANGLEAEIIMDSFEFIPNDTDGDGMSDAWELAHGLNPNDLTDATRDDDGDGFSNLQEFLAGTDPADPASAPKITAIAVTGSNTLITFSTALDKNYAIETANNLHSANWTIVTQNVAGTGNNLQITTTTNAPALYYRVRLLP